MKGLLLASNLADRVQERVVFLSPFLPDALELQKRLLRIVVVDPLEERLFFGVLDLVKIRMDLSSAMRYLHSKLLGEFNTVA